MEAPNKIVLISDLSFQCMGRMLLRNGWLIGAWAVIFALASALYISWFHEPQYEAAMTYAVMAREDSLATTDHIAASREVTAVMTELLATDIITQKLPAVHRELSGFSGTIQAQQVGETNLIAVTVLAPTAQQAFLATDALMKVFPELSDYLSSTSVAQVIRNPKVSATPANAVDVRGLMMRNGLIGGVLMAGLLVMLNLIRGTVQTRDGAKRLLDAKIIATVGHERKNRTLRAMVKNSTRGLQVFAPTTSAAYTEQINRICTRLEQECQVQGHQIFLITGVGENEGKSTLAGNVAAALAMKGRKTVLLDGDLRKPAMVKFFDEVYDSKLPFDMFLNVPYSRKNLDKCMVYHEKLGLAMMFAGGPEKKSLQLLTGQTMKETLADLKTLFDIILIDTPPMGFFPDAEALADLADASVLVVRQDSTPACDINDALDTLRKCRGKFLGCVLNDMDTESLGGSGYGYGYGYGYGAQNRGYGTAKRDWEEGNP